MSSKILSVIVGYIVMVAFIMGSFWVLYAILGAEQSYLPETYDASKRWIVATFILGLIAAIIAGFVCKLISRSGGTIKVFAGIVLVLGVIFGVMVMMKERHNKVRSADVSFSEAMEVSQAPVWVGFVNPIIGAIGVLIGGSLRKEKKLE